MEALTQVQNGIQRCREKKEDNGNFYLNPQGIDFDLAVTVTNELNETDNVKGKGDLKIISVGGGTTTAEHHQNVTVSRIKFRVNPRSKPIKAYKGNGSFTF